MSGRRPPPFWKWESGKTRLGRFASWAAFYAVFVSTVATSLFLIVKPLHLLGVLQLLAVVAALVVAVGAATVAGVAVGLLADHFHHSFWHDPPDGDHER